MIGTVRQFGGRFLDHQRGVTGAHGMILVGQWRAEDRHDAVAQQPVDRTLIVMDGFNHLLEHGVEDRLRALGIAAVDQLQRTGDVGEQHADLLSLALDLGSGGEDSLRQMAGGPRSQRHRARRQEPRRTPGRRMAALRAELGRRRKLGTAIRTYRHQRRSAFFTELCFRAVFVLATRADH